MALIGLTGNIGCGKDTVAKMIQIFFIAKRYKLQKELVDELFVKYILQNQPMRNNKSEWEVKKFAYKLKKIAALLVGCEPEDFESQEFKDNPLSDEWQTIYKLDGVRTNRWLLQQLGTEAIRNNIHKETWINALFADYIPNPKNGYIYPKDSESYEPKDFPNWIISDVRFLNEAKSIKDRNGLIIKIIRPDKESNSTHDSETELSSICQEYTIVNAGTLEDLYLNVVVALNALKEKNLITF